MKTNTYHKIKDIHVYKYHIDLDTVSVRRAELMLDSCPRGFDRDGKKSRYTVIKGNEWIPYFEEAIKNKTAASVTDPDYPSVIRRIDENGDEYTDVYAFLAEGSNTLIETAAEEGRVHNQWFWLSERDDIKARRIVEDFRSNRQKRTGTIQIPIETIKREELGVIG